MIIIGGIREDLDARRQNTPFGEQKDCNHLVDDGQKKHCDVEPRHDEEIVNAILENRSHQS